MLGDTVKVDVPTTLLLRCLAWGQERGGELAKSLEGKKGVHDVGDFRALQGIRLVPDETCSPRAVFMHRKEHMLGR